MEGYVVVRGGGDLATGVIQKLHRSGFKVIILEAEKPTAIRRNVSFCEAVYEGSTEIEGIKCVRIESVKEIGRVLETGAIPLIVDEKAECIEEIKPEAVVDAIMAKRNLGTNRSMADVTIALGPGFSAPEDVNVVIETMRGHNLGRLIFSGKAMENTGIPGAIGGFDKERVIYSPAEGKITNLKEIGAVVKKGDLLAFAGSKPVFAEIDGVLRGIIKSGFHVNKGFKIADIDPRISETENCNTISDKARAIGGAVLEALLYLRRTRRG